MNKHETIETLEREIKDVNRSLEKLHRLNVECQINVDCKENGVRRLSIKTFHGKRVLTRY